MRQPNEIQFPEFYAAERRFVSHRGDHSCFTPTPSKHIFLKATTNDTMPSRISAPPTLQIHPEPLTSQSFAPFGTVVSNPLPKTTSSDSSPTALPPNASLANQGSAVKISPISPLSTSYAAAPSGVAARGVMSMFVCSPRPLRVGSGSDALFDVRILERHPFTSQTFIPLGLAAGDAETGFLVIVAPTIASKGTAESWSEEFVSSKEQSTPNTVGAPTNPPDLTGVRAFMARGDQAVTYAAGTWHAPMVVLGQRAVEFVVVQYANGVGDEDCQEVEFGEGLSVLIDSNDIGSRAKL